ncbi:methylenetetrahydrofolate reductase [NAD(P)H] [Planctomicrobium sp. SH664]|uniref:methylenetetrahydrofolate reductase [NAD(P)H] n=1 Tax=Planctomicrobium sp. SH664 TaxID=3448125 RepID=UPI003F5C810E
MRIRDVYADGRFGLSFEVFPPKSEQGDASLLEHLARMVERRPAFISCTYGAGGSTRDRTLRICNILQNELKQVATAHFTCVGSTREELLEWLQRAQEIGVRNIMALRGDPPAGETAFVQKEGGLRYAAELVELIRKHFPEMGIGVAGYPEKHPEAIDAASDLANLKRKIDAGGDAVYTQLFFDNDCFFRFREQAEQAGIRAPIVPGIMPITEFSRIKRITSMSACEIPQELFQQLESSQEDKEAQYRIGIDFAIRQCRELIAQGVPGIHFYVLNKSDAVEEILNELPLPGRV